MLVTARFFAAELCMIGLFCAICNCSFVTDEENLRNDLLTNYTRKVRPDFTTNIWIGLVLSSLTSLNIARQSMSMVVMIAMYWADSRLAWNPRNYGGLDYFVTAPEDIWTPPIIIENAVNNIGVIGGKYQDGAPLRIHHSGQIHWGPPVEITTSCEMTIAHYPFDTQRCTIVLVGWTYPLSEMNISAAVIDQTTLYNENGEFSLIHTRIFQSVISEDKPANETYEKLHFEMTYRRKGKFYELNLILPLVLNSILMSMVFLLPIESGEKMGYSLTVLLTYMVFLTWITEQLPPISTDISILQIYLAVVLAMGCLATLLSTWVLHLYHTDADKPMGKVYRMIAFRLLIPFSNFTQCRGGKKVDAEEADVDERKAPDRVMKDSRISRRPSSGMSRIPASADPSLALQRFEQSTKVSLADRKRATEGFESVVKGDGIGKGPKTPMLTWHELAKLCDCFIMWTFAFVMALWTIFVISTLYGNF